MYYSQIGIDYGKHIQDSTTQAINILSNDYITQHHLTFSQLVSQADLRCQRFLVAFQRFMQGVATGSGLSLDQVKILNAMETLGRLVPNSDKGNGAFIALPPNKTVHHSALIGRNYAYLKPFNRQIVNGHNTKKSKHGTCCIYLDAGANLLPILH